MYFVFLNSILGILSFIFYSAFVFTLFYIIKFHIYKFHIYLRQGLGIGQVFLSN